MPNLGLHFSRAGEKVTPFPGAWQTVSFALSQSVAKTHGMV